MCGAAWKFWNLSHEGLVFVAPINDDLVFVHSIWPSLYFRITVRTCFTWYGFALLPSRCRLLYGKNDDCPSRVSRSPSPQAGCNLHRRFHSEASEASSPRSL
jgi:hypothetical protein